jgi:hypothetical protein
VKSSFVSIDTCRKCIIILMNFFGFLAVVLGSEIFIQPCPCILYCRWVLWGGLQWVTDIWGYAGGVRRILTGTWRVFPLRRQCLVGSRPWVRHLSLRNGMKGELSHGNRHSKSGLWERNQSLIIQWRMSLCQQACLGRQRASHTPQEKVAASLQPHETLYCCVPCSLKVKPSQEIL